MVNPLHLCEYGVKLRVQNLRSFEITNVREENENVTSRRFRPRRFPYITIIDDHRGSAGLLTCTDFGDVPQ